MSDCVETVHVLLKLFEQIDEYNFPIYFFFSSFVLKF